ncbi:hypothetical protein [Streptomyces sp. NPDC002132]|uniref:hypothetical protein n=1 Tax=Streptomyces sp. NPDC002132 TaxID=3154408 RepID=UPI00332B9AE4
MTARWLLSARSGGLRGSWPAGRANAYGDPLWTKFTDERWQQAAQSSWRGEWIRLCGPCVKEAADRAEAERVARRRAEEAERAAAEAPTVKPPSRFGIGRRR